MAHPISILTECSALKLCDRRSRRMPASRLTQRLVNSMISRAAHWQNRLRSSRLTVVPVFAQSESPPRVPPEVPIRPIPGEPLPPPQPTEPSPGPPRPPEPVPPNAPEPIRPPDPKGFASFWAAATLHCCTSDTEASHVQLSARDDASRHLQR
jgi:hypothetical protein